MTLTSSDITIRTGNDSANKRAANSWATITEIDDIIKFRVDAGLWTSRSEDEKVRLAVTAYNDMRSLVWSCSHGRSQSRDYGYADITGSGSAGCDPQVNDADFMIDVKRAQAAQIMFIAAGTQVRDMAREGVTITRALTGSEMEFTGYRGPVGGEALDILADWVETGLQVRRM